jgi:hypothetical protein
MSQWGIKREFRSENAAIRVLPCVNSEGPFDPITPESPIERVVIVNSKGDASEIARLTAQVQQFVGLPYSQWQPEGKGHPFMKVARETGIVPDGDYEKRTELQRKAALAYGVNAMPPCIVRQFGDLTMCVKPGCGLRWDTNDSEPPACPAWAVARGKVAVPGYPTSGDTPSPHQAGSWWPLWVSLAILAAVVIWVHGPDILKRLPVW